MFDGTPKSSQQPHREERLVRHAKSLLRTASQIHGLDKTLEFQTLTDFVKTIEGKTERRGESLELTYTAARHQLFPAVLKLIKMGRGHQAGLGIEKHEQTAPPKTPEASSTHLVSKSTAAVGIRIRWSQITKWLSAALAPVAIAALTATVLVKLGVDLLKAKIGKRKAIPNTGSDHHDQAPLSGANPGSQILKRLGLPQIRWLQRLITRQLEPSIGTIRAGKLSTVGQFLPTGPVISVNNTLIPLHSYLEQQEPHDPRLSDPQILRALYLSCDVLVGKTALAPLSSDIQVTLSVTEGENTLPFPINHELVAIDLHGMRPHSFERITVAVCVFGGAIIVIPPGVQKITYLATPTDAPRKLIKQLMESLPEIIKSNWEILDPIDRLYAEVLRTSSLTHTQRLQMCSGDILSARPRLYCDSAPILEALKGSSSPETLAYLSRVGVCLEFAHDYHRIVTAAGVPAILLHGYGIEKNKIRSRHAAVGLATEEQILIEDPTQDSFKLKIPSTAVEHIAKELVEMKRDTPEEIENLAMAAFNKLKVFSEFQSFIADRAQHFGRTKDFQACVERTWNSYVSAGHGQQTAEFWALRRHLPQALNVSSSLQLQVLDYLTKHSGTPALIPLLECFLEGARIPGRFILSPDRLPVALVFAKSRLVQYLNLDSRIALLSQILGAAKDTPNRLRSVLPALRCIFLSLNKTELSKGYHKRIVDGVFQIVDMMLKPPTHLGVTVEARFEDCLVELLSTIVNELPGCRAEVLLRLAESPLYNKTSLARQLFAAVPCDDLATEIHTRFLYQVVNSPSTALSFLISLAEFGVAVKLSRLSKSESKLVQRACQRELKSLPHVVTNLPIADLITALNQPLAARRKQEIVAALVKYGLTDQSFEQGIKLKLWSRGKLVAFVSALNDKTSPMLNLARANGFDFPAYLLFYRHNTQMPNWLSDKQRLVVFAFRNLSKTAPEFAGEIVSRVIAAKVPRLQLFQTTVFPHLVRSLVVNPMSVYLACLAMASEKRATFDNRSIAFDIEKLPSIDDLSRSIKIQADLGKMALTGLPAALDSCGIQEKGFAIAAPWLGVPQILMDHVLMERHSCNFDGGFWTHCFAGSKGITFQSIFGAQITYSGRPKDPLLILSAYLGRVGIRGPLSGLTSAGELSELREYTPGDAINRIDHRALGRLDRLLTKHFREHEATPTIFMVDLEWLAEEVSEWHATGKAPRLYELLLRHRHCVQDERPNRIIFHFRGHPINLDKWLDDHYPDVGLTRKWWESPKPQYEKNVIPLDQIVQAADLIARYRDAERSVGIEKFPWYPGMATVDSGLANIPSQATIYLMSSSGNLSHTCALESAAKRVGSRFIRWKG